MALPISDIVTVNIRVAAGGVSRTDFGTGLFLTDDPGVDAGGPGKVRRFGSLEEVGAVFNGSTEPYRAAVAWFSQNPRPRDFFVGRWATTAVNSSIYGGEAASASGFTASNSSFVLEGETVTVDLSSASDYAAIATALQAGIRGMTDTRFSNATVTVEDTNHFVLTLAGPDVISGYATAAATGTDIHDDLAWDQDDDERVYTQGNAQEEAVDALDAIQEIDSSWYFLSLDNTIAKTPSGLSNVTKTSISNWAQAAGKFFSCGDSGDATLVPGETGSDAAEVSALGNSRTCVTWSSEADYKAVSIAAFFSGTNWTGIQTIATAKFRSLPGFAADSVSSQGQAELIRKRVNYYSGRGGSPPIYAEGETCAAGIWMDVQIFLDWLAGAMQSDLYNLLRSQIRIPQTTFGVAQVKETITDVLEQGFASGGIGTGVVSPSLLSQIRQATGNTDFDGRLSNGYLVHIASLASQPQADRDARRLPATKVWLKSTGSIHTIAMDIDFEN